MNTVTDTAIEATVKKKSKGTPRTTYRFKPETLSRLDSLVKAVSASTGEAEDRSSILRKLIHQECIRLGVIECPQPQTSRSH